MRMHMRPVWRARRGGHCSALGGKIRGHVGPAHGTLVHKVPAGRGRPKLQDGPQGAWAMFAKQQGPHDAESAAWFSRSRPAVRARRQQHPAPPAARHNPPACRFTPSHSLPPSCAAHPPMHFRFQSILWMRVRATSGPVEAAGRLGRKNIIYRLRRGHRLVARLAADEQRLREEEAERSWRARLALNRQGRAHAGPRRRGRGLERQRQQRQRGEGPAAPGQRRRWWLAFL